MSSEFSNISSTMIAPAPMVSSAEVQRVIDHFQIAEGYFSNILEVQTAIFSIIVAALVTLYFLFNWKASKIQIEKASAAHFSAIKEQMYREFEEKMENLQNIFSSRMEEQKRSIGYLSAQNYRTLGQFWDSEKNYSVSFIWWLRGAEQFSLVSDESLTRICLSGAKDAIERVSYGFEIRPDTVGEYQKIISELPSIYQMEKNLLDTEIKKTISKKSQPVTVSSIIPTR